MLQLLTIVFFSTIMLLTALHYASICSYALTYYYAQNYASIIRQGLYLGVDPLPLFRRSEKWSSSIDYLLSYLIMAEYKP